jgi:ketosteroid isomerase-like protein
MTKDSINKGKTMLFWLPLKANISKDGNLGWTAGTWFFVIKLANGFDTVKTGSYVTFWEKQDDGTWKYIVDKGNLSPDDFK